MMISNTKTALITGSSRGVGRVLARKLASQKITIILHYFMNRSAAIDVKEEIQNEYDVDVMIVQANLADDSEVREMFRQIKSRHSQIDILINNAASGVHKELMQTRLKDWDWTMNVNARGMLTCVKESVKLMSDDQVTYIVNLTSMGSQRVLPEYGLVGASKSVVETLTMYSAVELSKKNIVVNAIAGGVMETEALDSFPQGKKLVREGKEKTPAGRLIDPNDLADTLLFLVSGKADMIRGQTIVVDGGHSLI